MSTLCPWCSASHDGTMRATELHPDAPHAQPFGRAHVCEVARLSPQRGTEWCYITGTTSPSSRSATRRSTMTSCTRSSTEEPPKPTLAAQARASWEHEQNERLETEPKHYEDGIRWRPGTGGIPVKPGMFRTRGDALTMLAWLIACYLLPILALYLVTR